MSINTCHRLTGDERTIFDLLSVTSNRFRKGKTERLNVLRHFVVLFLQWDFTRFNCAIRGLKRKDVIREVDPGNIKRREIYPPSTKPKKKQPSPKVVNLEGRHAFWKERSYCVYCTRPLKVENRTRDHVKPKSKGGSNAERNLVGCCFQCNQSKADRTPVEWAADILRYQTRCPSVPVAKRLLNRCHALAVLLFVSICVLIGGVK